MAVLRESCSERIETVAKALWCQSSALLSEKVIKPWLRLVLS